jgi:hypothetical protein
MRTLRHINRLGFVTLVVILWAPSNSTWASPVAPQGREAILAPAEDSQESVRIRSKLAEPVTLEFVETPLSDVIDFLRDYTTVNILLDKPSLEEQGVTSDTPMLIHVQGITIASALQTMLSPFRLTWIVRDDCLVITSQKESDRHIVTRSYPVGDLAATAEEGAKLVDLARRVIAYGREELPESRIPFLDSLKAIVLTHNPAGHARLARLLEELRGTPSESDAIKRIHEKLNDPVTLEFVETPLSDIVDFLKDLTQVNIVLDRRAIEEEGVTNDTPISVHLQAVAIRLALGTMLNQLNMTFRLENDCLVVTSQVQSESRCEIRAYSTKPPASRPSLSREEWLRLAQSVVQPRPNNQKSREGTPGPPMIDFFDPQGRLVVYGPDSLQSNIQSLIALVTKTSEQTK